MADSDIDELAAAAPVEAGKAGFREWAGRDRGMFAIAFTDIVDSTKLAVALGDRDMAAVRDAHFVRSQALIAAHDGHEVKTIGDSVMAAFHTSEQAFEYARALRAEPGHEKLAKRVRAGFHIGAMDITANDAFGVTVNYAARVIHAVEGPDIGISAAALKQLASFFGQEAIERDWSPPQSVEMKGFGTGDIHLLLPASLGPDKGRRDARFPLPEGVQPAAPEAGHAARRAPAAAQNFEHEDFVSHAEILIDAARGKAARRIYGQVNLHERMFVRGEATNSQIEFGVSRFFVEFAKTGPGTLTAAEDLRRGVVAPRAVLVQSRGRRRAEGSSVTVCVDAEPGTSLGARAIPTIGEDNLLPELAVASSDVAAERLKAALLLRLEPEAVRIEGEAGDKVSARKRRFIEAILNTAIRKGEKIGEDGLIRRPLKVQIRARNA
ncbi:MAG TPA: adenylate/guanylate cyclase domain-containing protein [Stellaceae bacterium]|nr:adenylate/guanylate cyclase domain-containing protein [Stellaceae bacterium]